MRGLVVDVTPIPATPKSLRLRKRMLNQTDRRKAERKVG